MRDPQDSCTWTLLVQPGVVAPSVAVLAEEVGGRSVVLSVGEAGAEASITWPEGSLRLAAGVPLKPRSWYRLWLVVDPPSGHVALAQQGFDRPASAMAHARAEGLALPLGATILFAAEDTRKPQRHGMAFSP